MLEVSRGVDLKVGEALGASHTIRFTQADHLPTRHLGLLRFVGVERGQAARDISARQTLERLDRRAGKRRGWGGRDTAPIKAKRIGEVQPELVVGLRTGQLIGQVALELCPGGRVVRALDGGFEIPRKCVHVGVVGPSVGRQLGPRERTSLPSEVEGMLEDRARVNPRVKGVTRRPIDACSQRSFRRGKNSTTSRANCREEESCVSWRYSPRFRSTRRDPVYRSTCRPSDRRWANRSLTSAFRISKARCRRSTRSWA